MNLNELRELILNESANDDLAAISKGKALFRKIANYARNLDKDSKKQRYENEYILVDVAKIDANHPNLIVYFYSKANPKSRNTEGDCKTYDSAKIFIKSLNVAIKALREMIRKIGKEPCLKV